MAKHKVDGSSWINWIAWLLSVFASLVGVLSLGFSGAKETDPIVWIGVPVSLGIVLVSVLNTPLTLFLKWKFAIHLFYAYHIAVHCLLITTIVGGLLSGPVKGEEAMTYLSNGLFLGIYGLSLCGQASRYRKSIQRQREAR